MSREEIEQGEIQIRQGRMMIVLLEQIREELIKLRHLTHRCCGKNERLVLTILDPEGNPLGAPVTLGTAGGQASVQEFIGTTPEPPGGPIAYASDNPAVATIDAASGAVASVASGTCNLSAKDSVNGLSDSVVATVALVNNSLVLTITPNPGTAASVAAAAKK